MLNGAENVLITHSSKKSMNLNTKNITKKKVNALGDLKNILHSRKNNLDHQSKGLSINKKETTVIKNDARKPLSAKSFCEKKINAVSDIRVLSSPNNDDEFHNHILCEQADEASMNNFLCEFKFTVEEIEKLATLGKSYKPFKTYETCFSTMNPIADIINGNIKVIEERNFTVDDILSDITIPDIPPP